VLYVARITRTAKLWKMDFPDVRGCSIVGATEADVMAEAKRALSDHLRGQLLAGPGVAPPRSYRGPGPAVEVDGAVALAIQLRDARTDAYLSSADLAERAGVSLQIVDALEAALTVATLDRVLPIARVLGLRPVIEPERPGEAVGLTRGRPRRG
jgi:predicted RNase H-like HicB family nuclease